MSWIITFQMCTLSPIWIIYLLLPKTNQTSVEDPEKKETRVGGWTSVNSAGHDGDVRNASYVLPPSNSLSHTSSLSPPLTSFISFLFPPSSGFSSLPLSYFSQIINVSTCVVQKQINHLRARKACNVSFLMKFCSIWRSFLETQYVSDTWLKDIKVGPSSRSHKQLSSEGKEFGVNWSQLGFTFRTDCSSHSYSVECDGNSWKPISDFQESLKRPWRPIF